VAAESAKVVTLPGGRKFHDLIDRVLEDGTRVRFRLIAESESTEPPFYIMENKVTNGLFQKFATARPEEVRDQEWRQGGLANQQPLGIDGKENYPVFGVKVEDAHRFARWLGGKLPSTRQWERAAGYSAQGKGPYQHDRRSFDKHRDVAVDRAKEGPLPAGAAAKDVSPLGIRDMAGNGREWTRTLFDAPGLEVPVPDRSGLLIVELRGQSYNEATQPLTFTPGVHPFGGCEYDQSFPDVSFRVVLDLP
jgi:formylglycine-generating enzyme required for sulfatase activity